MSFEPYNILGGVTVGIPPSNVIDGNGTVISNVLTSGNVTANVIRGTTFLYSNGHPLTATAAGSDQYVQYNANGVFGGSSTFTFDSTTSLLNIVNVSVSGITNLGQVGNVVIEGGDAGYVLSTDGLGNLSWVNQSGGGGNGNPGGGNRAVQFNDDEFFGGDSYFTYNKDTDTLNVNNIIATHITGTLLTDAQPNITSVGNLTSLTIANGGNINNANWIFANNLSGNANSLYNIVGSNVVGPVNSAGYAATSAVAATVTNNNQPNINTVGTLLGLDVNGITDLGDLSNVKIYGGTPGFVISTDGYGNLAWSVGGGGGNGTPGGINTQVQFNDQGGFGGNANLTFNKTTGTLTAVYFVGNGSNLSNISGSNVIGTVANSNYAVAAGDADFAILATSAGTAGTVTTGAQPNITSTGNLASLTVTGVSNLGNIGNLVLTGGSPNYILTTDGFGNLSWKSTGAGGNPGGDNTTVQFNDENSFGGNSSFTYNKTTGILTVSQVSSNFTGNGANLTSLTGANVTGTVANASYAVNSGTAVAASLATSVTGASQPNITSLGTLTTVTVSGTTNLGNISNVHITGGSANYYLQTDGAGNLNWVSGGGGGGNPGGSNTQIQFNDDGEFNGTAYLTWDKTTSTMQVAGHLIANTFQMGAGSYEFSNSFVYFATTASTSPDQLLWDIPIADVNAIDFTIIGTCDSQDATQSAKISSLVRGNTVVYNEYAGLGINGGVGSFSVNYIPGNIITPTSLGLYVTPDYSGLTEYNIQITVYANYP